MITVASSCVLDPLERAVGLPMGAVPTFGPAPPITTPRDALESVLVTALLRPPCVISFSGGRDSSTLLALAIHVARRDGLAEPVPVTLRFAGVDHAEEIDWQERLVLALGVSDWERIELNAEDADLAGPMATEVVRRCGVSFPANAYLHQPIVERAVGGTLISGAGGDEMLDTRADLIPRLLTRRSRFQLGDWRALADELVPGRARRLAQHFRASLPWLTAEAAGEAGDRYAEGVLRLGRGWSTGAPRFIADRYRLATIATLGALAARHDVASVAPFFDETVMAAVGRAGGWGGYRSRAEALEGLVADVDPIGFRFRTSKAVFDSPVFGPAYQRLITEWDGGGLDPAVVDADALARVWAHRTDFRTTLMLHELLARTMS